MIKITENISLEVTKVADKFFSKHRKVYEKFIENIKNYYHFNNQNIDIKAMKSYKDLYRMRINDYRVIYKLVNGEIKVVSVIAVGSRGQIYNNF
ncbi:type II toxin-antitoxin system RelE/ParE family toxin [Fusobacterium sp.]|uniref:type II toxin-antitoxin system RelE family toxin n=1 Tax=Fusobacterium sp. TaxID=68766 RepID=UPI00262B7624|nr:type II toxin-antitoxin system RelE/ParE family toxin [Fusobacterium sp.]